MVSPQFQPVIVLPTYNNAGTLPTVMRLCASLEIPMIVINDGCTDDTATLLKHDMMLIPSVAKVITHAKNHGKAAALRTGFEAAINRGFSHAVTMDTDGQLEPEEIPLLVERARAKPSALVLGVRDDRRADYPWRSRVGRRLSNLCLYLETGVRVTDSQCGLRVYPLSVMKTLTCRADRFGYETEVIARAAWAGCPIIEVPVTCKYFEAEKRVTHFRPGKDSLRAVAMHARLLLTALLRSRRSSAAHSS